MGYYKLEDVAAIRDGEGNICCLNCATDAEMNELTEDKIVENKEAEDSENLIFCDRCKKRITA